MRFRRGQRLGARGLNAALSAPPLVTGGRGVLVNQVGHQASLSFSTEIRGRAGRMYALLTGATPHPTQANVWTYTFEEARLESGAFVARPNPRTGSCFNMFEQGMAGNITAHGIDLVADIPDGCVAEVKPITASGNPFPLVLHRVRLLNGSGWQWWFSWPNTLFIKPAPTP